MAFAEGRVGGEKEGAGQVISASLLIAALDLGALFSSPQAWEEKAELFAVDHAREGFRFASETRDIVNSLDSSACTWYGAKIWETKVYFDKTPGEEKIVRLELSLYNRGDAKGEVMSTERLKGLLANVSAKFAPGEKKFKDEKQTLRNGALQYRRRFAKSEPAGELVWGLSAPNGDNRRGVDYVRLTVMPRGEVSRGTAAKRPQGKAGKQKIQSNVTKSPNGDVFIDNVPMVDQGQKGYCAAAVSERVLRYYGNEIDEHEIAQQAGTTAEGGTSVSAMKRVITSVGEKNGLGYQEIVSMTAGGVSGLEEEIAKYNKAAKLEKKRELSLGEFMQGNMIDVGRMRQAMEPKVVYRMRTKDSRLKKFSSGVRQQVNAGIPVFWGVTLGLFPERGVNPQTSGGHMRLIIGYNDKKKEILYTDTWGEGHELKRMPEDWAFAITHDAFFLKPR